MALAKIFRARERHVGGGGRRVAVVAMYQGEYLQLQGEYWVFYWHSVRCDPINIMDIFIRVQQTSNQRYRKQILPEYVMFNERNNLAQKYME